MLGEVASEAAELAEQGWGPGLVSVTVGDAEAVAVYVRNQRRRAEAAGIAFEERTFPAEVTRAEIVLALRAMNSDPRVTGRDYRAAGAGAPLDPRPADDPSTP